MSDDAPEDDAEEGGFDEGLFPSEAPEDSQDDTDTGSELDAVGEEGSRRVQADDADDVRAPLDDLVERTRQRDDDVTDAFDEVDVDAVEDDELWDQLEAERIEATVDEPTSDAERDVRVLRKRDYCMRCQYYSAPPEVRCGHDRGEIMELVDTDRFKVVDCPIIRGEEELENLGR